MEKCTYTKGFRIDSLKKKIEQQTALCSASASVSWEPPHAVRAAKEHAVTYAQLHWHPKGHAFFVVRLVVATKNELSLRMHKFRSMGMKTKTWIHLLFLKLYRVQSNSKCYWTLIFRKTQFNATVLKTPNTSIKKTPNTSKPFFLTTSHPLHSCFVHKYDATTLDFFRVQL